MYILNIKMHNLYLFGIYNLKNNELRDYTTKNTAVQVFSDKFSGILFVFLTYKRRKELTYSIYKGFNSQSKNIFFTMPVKKLILITNTYTVNSTPC